MLSLFKCPSHPQVAWLVQTFKCAGVITCALVMLCRLHAARLKVVLQGWPVEAGSNPQASSAADLGHIAAHCFSPKAHEQAQGLLRALSTAADAPGRTRGIGAAVATAAEPQAAAGIQTGRGGPAASADAAVTEQVVAGNQTGSGGPAAGAGLAVTDQAAAGIQAGSGGPAAGADPAVTDQAAAGIQAGSEGPAAGADPAEAGQALRELLLKDCLDAMRWLAASRPNCHKVVYRWALGGVSCRSWLTEELGKQLAAVVWRHLQGQSSSTATAAWCFAAAMSVNGSWAAACLLLQEFGCRKGGAIWPLAAACRWSHSGNDTAEH